MDPLPEYVPDWMLARWMGVTRDALLDMPIHEVEEARIVMQAINEAQDQAGKKSTKGRKR